MSSENFIYFSASSGFFIGVIFSIIHDLDVFNFLFVVFLLTSIFYILALASSAFFIKYLNLKNITYLEKDKIENVLDYQIKELEKKEDFILESYEFIKSIEEEEINFLKHKKR